MINASHTQGGDSLDETLAKPKPQSHHQQELQEVIDFYLRDPAYTEVHLVRCNNCNNPMCLEVLEPASVYKYQETHHQGRRRITLGFDDAPDGYLLSHRKRLDGVMGYQCGAMVSNPRYAKQVKEVTEFNAKAQTQSKKLYGRDADSADLKTVTEPESIPCGNNTIISSHEKSYTRKGSGGQDYLPQLEPHQEHQLRASLARMGHKPDIRKEFVGDKEITHHESFSIERLK